MSTNKVENTGERFIPLQSTPLEVEVNVDRYLMALPYCKNQDVLELGHGCGLGTYLYSLVAKSVVAIDYNDDAQMLARQYPYDPDKVSFRKMDLEKEVPTGTFDVVVATEFLEHIENPGGLIAELDTKYLVFSLPMMSMQISSWHKYPIGNGEQGLKDIHNLIDPRYKIEDMQIQNAGGTCNWVFGIAKKRKSWL